MMAEGQAAVVTGAGAGIGRAIALRLARDGMAVVVADVDGDRGLETVRRIKAEDGYAAFVQADVAAGADVRAMVRFAVEHFGGLDALVNNAGIAPEPYFPDAEPAHWARTLDVNLHGAMLAIQEALPVMRQRGGGAVVNISSMGGMHYRPYDAPEYAASKAGLAHLTAALGTLRDRMNVRVNCICPGWVGTEAVQRSLADMTPEERQQQPFPPPSVLIQPDEIAEIVLMFIRDETLAGRVIVWPDGEPWRFVPLDAGF
jgi:NAD(P)-dependent dehydrogenase (short-subunit alcohol dehydrogenase family)